LLYQRAADLCARLDAGVIKRAAERRFHVHAGALERGHHAAKARGVDLDLEAGH
jgi:hypothetical protein